MNGCPVTRSLPSGLLLLFVLPQYLDAQMYSDQTLALGVSFVHSKPPADVMPIGAGGAVGDFNGDGLLDFYAADGDGPNHLYQNTGIGFVERAAAYGVDNPGGEGSGALFGDYDNDGDADLYVLNRGVNVMFRNDGPDGAGGWLFTDVTTLLGVQALGRASAAVYGDYDNDGYLDLYVANHNLSSGFPVPGQGNRSDFLFHNVEGPGGQRVFDDVTALLDTALLARSLAHSAGFVDHDGDGDLDLLVVNEDMRNRDPLITGENLLFRNDGADGAGGWVFTEVASQVGIPHGYQPMGLAIGDYNADGLWDLAMSDNGPNMLLLNQGGTYLEVAAAAGVDRPLVPGTSNGQIGWGLTFFDADLDGMTDLYVATGAMSSSTAQPNPLFLNNGDLPTCTFTEAIGSGADDSLKSRTVVRGDYDNDGDEDLFVVNLEGAAHVYRNEAVGDSLTVRLVGAISNRDGIGARVRLSTAGWPDQYRLVQSGSTTGGGHDLRVVFGVTGQSRVDALVVDWPSGQQSALSGVAINQQITVVEPCPVLATNYGVGVAGTLGVPALTGDTSPPSGRDVEVQIGNSRGQATSGLLVIGFDTAAIPAFFGGELLVQPAVIVPLQIPAGGIALWNPRPEELVCGVTVYLQVVQLDPGGPAGFSASDGLRLDLGG